VAIATFFIYFDIRLHSPRPLFIFFNAFSLREEKSHWSAEPRFELGPVLQQASVLYQLSHAAPSKIDITRTFRFEGLELARERDRRAMEAWRDHPYVDIIDNRADFDTKINKLIDLVVRRIGINVGDRCIH
jgi:hypothetical protein